MMREFNLTNGIKTCIKRNANTPRVAFSMNFSIVNPEHYPGQYLLMNRLLLKGTQKYSSEELSTVLDENAIDLYTEMKYDYLRFRFVALNEDFELALSILSDIVEVFLPVVDNLENALKIETQDVEYKKGIELVLKQFKEVLSSKGIEEIKTVGETFDPELHEAVSSIQDSNLGEKEIAQEYRKGYKIGSRVIRHSMVVVAN